MENFEMEFMFENKLVKMISENRSETNELEKLWKKLFETRKFKMEY
jgi:hypothetical protein